MWKEGRGWGGRLIPVSEHISCPREWCGGVRGDFEVVSDASGGESPRGLEKGQPLGVGGDGGGIHTLGRKNCT